MSRTVRKLRGAHAQLVAGRSPRQERSFEGPERAWLRIGSAADADWRIEDQGIAPAHCELLWDGYGLFVQDRWRLGRTLVNGQRVDGWRPLGGDVLIYLARACLRTHSARDQPPAPDPAALRWVQARLLACSASEPEACATADGSPTEPRKRS